MFNLQEIFLADLHFLLIHGHIFVPLLIHISVAFLVHIFVCIFCISVAFLVHIFVCIFCIFVCIFCIFVAFLLDAINRFYSTKYSNLL